MRTNYIKRTQKDYSLSLKVTQAINKYAIQSRSTVVKWLRKYGTFDWENQTPSNMLKTP